eukprot:1149050-Pelagomonas_calceolata.AAC.2
MAPRSAGMLVLGLLLVSSLATAQGEHVLVLINNGFLAKHNRGAWLPERFAPGLDQDHSGG